MVAIHSLRRTIALTVLLATFLSTSKAQNTTLTLKTCLSRSGVETVLSDDPNWGEATGHFQRRIDIAPACVAIPKNRDEVAQALKCARDADVKATAVGAAHSFANWAFGNPGNLAISMQAFNQVSFDEATNLLNFGGGSHIGPTAKYLWDNHGRHFPHARSGHVGMVGSFFGGGFGTTSRIYGTSVEQIEAVEYMLFNGTIVTAKVDENPNLFFATRGAAPSYGIVLSMTIRTWKPEFQNALNYTVKLGAIESEPAAVAFVTVQNYTLNTSAMDGLSVRWSLEWPPAEYGFNGFFYGEPSTFETQMTPLISSLRALAPNTTFEFDSATWWDMERIVAGAGMDSPDGGERGSADFYSRALTTPFSHPLTLDLARSLHETTALAFNRSDMFKGGYMDLWGGQAGKRFAAGEASFKEWDNLWLLSVSGNVWDPTASFPTDGASYVKGLVMQFEQALAAAGIPIAGFVNYPDTEMDEAGWSKRLYGSANFERLKSLKEAYDPVGLFVAHDQSIPLP